MVRIAKIGEGIELKEGNHVACTSFSNRCLERLDFNDLASDSFFLGTSEYHS